MAAVSDKTPLKSPSISLQQNYQTITPPSSSETSNELSDSNGKNPSHCHATKLDSIREKVGDPKARRTLLMASALCLAFMVAEIVGGSIAGSLAIMTDAAHLLTDFASFLISIFSLYVASRPATRRMSFGWHRAEVLGALLSVLLIWVITGVLVYMAIERIVNQKYEIDATVMLITAAVGVCVNIAMGLLLHFGGGGHGHSHGGNSHSHGHGHLDAENPGRNGKNKPKKNINVRAALIHVIGDFFQSLGVLVAAFIIYFKPDYGIVDPICTFIFSIIVLITTLTILRDALNVLMEGKPHGIDFAEVNESLLQIEGVRSVHNLRIWSLTMDKIAMAVHLAIETNANSQEVLKESYDVLAAEFGVYECTVQIEVFTEDMNDCEKCEHPVK